MLEQAVHIFTIELSRMNRMAG